MSGENPHIIVEGWSQRYASAAVALRGVEGGYVDDPVDRGGATKFGISLRFLVAEGKIDLDGDGRFDFDLDMDGDIDGIDIRRLTWGDAKYLFHRCFWERLDADSFARPIGEMLFDQAVNGGLVAARKLLQQALNACLRKYRLDLAPLNIDGVLADKSRAAIDAVLRLPAARMAAIEIAYRDAVKARYRAIVAANPSQQRFLAGWLTRLPMTWSARANPPRRSSRPLLRRLLCSAPSSAPRSPSTRRPCSLGAAAAMRSLASAAGTACAA